MEDKVKQILRVEEIWSSRCRNTMYSVQHPGAEIQCMYNQNTNKQQSISLWHRFFIKESIVVGNCSKQHSFRKSISKWQVIALPELYVFQINNYSKEECKHYRSNKTLVKNEHELLIPLLQCYKSTLPLDIGSCLWIHFYQCWWSAWKLTVVTARTWTNNFLVTVKMLVMPVNNLTLVSMIIVFLVLISYNYLYLKVAKI